MDHTVSETTVTDLLRGAIDLHCHSGPSIMTRKLDHLEEIADAEAAGLRAVLFKDHFYSATPVMNLLDRHRQPGSNLRLLSGVPLNDALGGLNPHAVDHGLRQGARMVWMPTLSAANHLRTAFRYDLAGKLNMIQPSGLTVLTEAGKVRDEIKTILDLIASHDAVLCGGHLHISEMFPLFEEARTRGVTRMLVSHPTFWIEADLSHLRRLRAMGVRIEHCACMLEGPMRKFTGDELRDYIDAGGLDNTIISSDLGQPHNVRPVDGFRSIIRLLLELGYSNAEVRQLTSQNAARLMDI